MLVHVCCSNFFSYRSNFLFYLVHHLLQAPPFPLFPFEMGALISQGLSPAHSGSIEPHYSLNKNWFHAQITDHPPALHYVSVSSFFPSLISLCLPFPTFMSSTALCWHAPAHAYMCICTSEPTFESDVCDGWMGRDSMRVRGRESWDGGNETVKAGGFCRVEQAVSRKAVLQKIEELFSCHIKIHQPFTIGLCSDRGGLPLLSRQIIKPALSYYPKRHSLEGDTKIPVDFIKCWYLKLSLIHDSFQFSHIMDMWTNGIKLIWDSTKREQKMVKIQNGNFHYSTLKVCPLSIKGQ